MGHPPAMREIDLYADDLLSVESESYFRRRFGFALGRRGRIALIGFMDEFDLSIDEIKALNRIGSISWNGDQLQVRGAIWLRLLGVAMTLLLFTLLLPFLAVLLLHAEASTLQLMIMMAAVTVLIAAIIIVHRLFIAPFRSLRSRKVHSDPAC